MKAVLTACVVLLCTTAKAQDHNYSTNDPFRVFISTGATMAKSEIWEGFGVGAASSKVSFETGLITSKFDNDMYAYFLGQRRLGKAGKAEAYVGINASMKLDRQATMGLQPLLKAVYNCDKNVALYAQIGFPLSETDNYSVHNPGFGLGINIWFKRYSK